MSDDEIGELVNLVKNDIEQGLKPEEILIIWLDADGKRRCDCGGTSAQREDC